MLAVLMLIGDLSTHSQTFRTKWAVRNVCFRRSGVKRFHQPVVGGLTLAFEAMDLAADSGLRISAYTAEPGTPPTTRSTSSPAGQPPSTRPIQPAPINGPDPQRQSLLADPRDDTRRVSHGTMLMPRLGFAGTEDPRSAGRRPWSQ